jgi:hypothetical protein
MTGDGKDWRCNLGSPNVTGPRFCDETGVHYEGASDGLSTRSSSHGREDPDRVARYR